MSSILEEKLKEDFLIRLYFDTSRGFPIAGIKRAFLDLSRTLKVKDNKRLSLIEKSEEFILKELSIILNTTFRTQSEFDNFHKTVCDKLTLVWDELSIGQAQKWINMTLKYWLLFGNNRIQGIEINSKFFHIPIDRYVQNEMLKVKIKNPWSKIDTYNEYMEYQMLQREKKTGNPPIVDEFIFFNNYNPKNKK